MQKNITKIYLNVTKHIATSGEHKGKVSEVWKKDLGVEMDSHVSICPMQVSQGMASSALTSTERVLKWFEMRSSCFLYSLCVGFEHFCFE